MDDSYLSSQTELPGGYSPPPSNSAAQQKQPNQPPPTSQPTTSSASTSTSSDYQQQQNMVRFAPYSLHRNLRTFTPYLLPTTTATLQPAHLTHHQLSHLPSLPLHHVHPHPHILSHHHHQHPHHHHHSHAHHGHLPHHNTSRPKTPVSPQTDIMMLEDDEEEEEESTHIGHLYPEIIEMIFSKLAVRDRGRAAQVCTQWRDIAYTKSVWRGVTAKLHLKRSNPNLFNCLVRRGVKDIQILSMRRSLKDLVINVTHLQSLNLSGCYNVADQNLCHAFSVDLPNIKKLDLSLCKQITDTNRQASQELGSSRVGRLLQHHTHRPIVDRWGLKRLKHLNLRSCWLICDQGIGYLAGLNKETDGGNMELEYLGLQDCQRLSDIALRHIAQGLTSLKTINLSFCVSITDSGLKHLAKMANLQSLNLRSCDNISDIGMAYLTDGGSRIISLDVSFCDKISDQALTHLSQGLYRLKTLSLNQCQITDQGLLKIAKNLHSLETLNIGQCSRITDHGLKILADDLTSLRQIDLYGCTQLSSKGLEVVMKLPKLVKLNLGLWLI
uniref:F-box domain-containing protein n=1 Tax=Megaselia scalaris TaxID=36166 RepID=T1GTU2_MEGSC